MLVPSNMTETGTLGPTLESRYQAVLTRVEKRARQAGRSPSDITLIAVTKTHPAETIREALSLGMMDFGENRVQEAEQKINAIGRDSARWHLIGHLQANKARRAVQLFDLIHSLDSMALAQRLDRLCQAERRELPVLIQVDLAGEQTKSGVKEAELKELADVVRDCRNLSLRGLMTLPPFFEEPEQVRPYFRRLRELRDELDRQEYFGDETGELSMGMTHDFEIAIDEGATMIRIGTAIFGAREHKEAATTSC
jgi:PLP dependent protein